MRLLSSVVLILSIALWSCSLYCNATQSQDSSTIWQCYQENSTCSSLPSDEIRPSLLDSFNIQITDVPTVKAMTSGETSNVVSLQNLLPKLIQTANDTQYGILILEAGDSSIVEWVLKSTDGSVLISPKVISEPPRVQTAVDRDVPMYVFGADQYTGLPKGIILASPSLSLSFQVVAAPPSDPIALCRQSSLVFGIVTWTSEVTTLCPSYYSFLVTDQCSKCNQLPMSSQFVRICPSQSSGAPRPTIPITILKPTIGDSSATGGQEITISLPSNISLSSTDVCFLLKDSSKFPLETGSRTGDQLLLSLTNPVIPGNYSIGCNIGESDASSNNSIVLMDFPTLVEVPKQLSTTFDSASDQKSVWVMFNANLPAGISSDPYCLYDSSTIHMSASESTRSLTCQLNQMTSAGTFKVYAVRNPILEKASLATQSPHLVTILASAVPTTTTSTTHATSPSTTTIHTTPVTSTAKPTSPTSGPTSGTTKPSSSAPTSITVPTTVPTTVPSTTPISSASVIAVLSNDLLGIIISTPGGIPVGMLNCSDLIQNATGLLGGGSKCSSDGMIITIRFGFVTPPSLVPGSFINIQLSKDLTVTVTVNSPYAPVKPEFTVDYPSQVPLCVPDLILEVKQISGTGNRPMSVSWLPYSGPPLILNQGTQTSDGRILSIPTKYLTSPVSLAVTVCNFVNQCSLGGEYNIARTNLSVVFNGDVLGADGPFFPSQIARISARPTLTYCNNSQDVTTLATYEWRLNGKQVSTDSSIRIAPYTYAVDEVVSVTVQLSYNQGPSNQTLSTSVSRSILYIAEPLIVHLNSTDRRIGVDEWLVIDASQSCDPNLLTALPLHNWQCANLSSNTKCSIDNDTVMDEPVFRLPPFSLSEGMSFNLTDEITSSGISAIGNTVITVGPASLPIIVFSALSTAKADVAAYNRIQALVSSSDVHVNTTWTAVRNKGGASFNISQFLSNPTNQLVLQPGEKAVLSLTIPPADNSSDWTGLLPGNQYTIRLTATSPNGSSYAEIGLITNNPPVVGLLDVSPSSATGLSTLLTLSAGDGWWDEDVPLTYRFGIRTIYADPGKYTDYWFAHNTVSSYQLILPSATPTAPGCDGRTNYAVLLTVCDRYDACSQGISTPFVVSPPSNVSSAVTSTVNSVNADMATGDIFSAIWKMRAVDMQICQTSIDSATADQAVLLLLNTIDGSSDAVEYKDVLDAAMHMAKHLSDKVLNRLISTIQAYRLKLGFAQYGRRTKRNAANVTYPKDEKGATGMLGICDVLLAVNKDVTDLLEQTIDDYLTAFCQQLDATSQVIMKAQGNYSAIQAQSVNPTLVDLKNTSFSAAGSTTKTVNFSAGFTTSFSSYYCTSDSESCSHFCLATSKVFMSLVSLNTYFANYFFSNQFSSLSVNTTASDLYQVFIVNPMSGAKMYVPSSADYSIYVPLTSYAPTYYYGCQMFVDGTGWLSSSPCISANYATLINGSYYFLCTCKTAGTLAVFTATPPTPIALPDHNEIGLEFVLNTSVAPNNSQISNFISTLIIMSGIGSGRLVTPRSGNATDNSTSVSIFTTLRPPFRSNQPINSLSFQAIARAVNMESGFRLSNKVGISNVLYSIIKRDLNGDDNARKIIMRIDRSYATFVANSSDTTVERWTTSIANTLRISEYRIKNANVFPGIVFNFTVTRPFEGETKPSLVAEEIAIMIMECTTYGELDIESNQGEAMPVLQLTDNDIVELVVVNKDANSLVFVLSIVITTALALFIIIVTGAVLLKIRTDRLIQEERSRAVFIDAPIPMEVPPYPQRSLTVGDYATDPRHRTTVRHY